MKVVAWQHLVDCGPYTRTDAFSTVEHAIRAAVQKTVWPPGLNDFAIRPESGKQRGMGNGVKPIKSGFVGELARLGWALETRAPRSTGETDAIVKGSRPGAFDCHFTFRGGQPAPFAVEWETGNISSSHRAINRIGLGLLRGYLSGGVLIVPSSRLAYFLTDRIGNEPELRPYHDLWRQWQFAELSYFGIVTVEHDRESTSVPRIPKATDGRAMS